MTASDLAALGTGDKACLGRISSMVGWYEVFLSLRSTGQRQISNRHLLVWIKDLPTEVRKPPCRTKVLIPGGWRPRAGQGCLATSQLGQALDYCSLYNACSSDQKALL